QEGAPALDRDPVQGERLVVTADLEVAPALDVDGRDPVEVGVAGHDDHRLAVESDGAGERDVGAAEDVEAVADERRVSEGHWRRQIVDNGRRIKAQKWSV